MAFPAPVPGLVIRYSYLWMEEHRRGLEEGQKDRPSVIVLTVSTEAGIPSVLVLPITHAPPSHPHLAVEIPAKVKARLGLDTQRSWVVLTEANRFLWPGPDLRPTIPGNASSIAYGLLPYALFEEIRLKFIAAAKARAASTVPRTE